MDKTENQEFYRSFQTKSNIVIYRPKKLKYAEFTGDYDSQTSIEMFVDGIISGNGRFERLDSEPSFEYANDDL